LHLPLFGPETIMIFHVLSIAKAGTSLSSFVFLVFLYLFTSKRKSRQGAS